MSARPGQPSGPRSPRVRRPQRPTKVPWLPYAAGGLAIVVIVTAIIYAAVTGRLF